MSDVDDLVAKAQKQLDEHKRWLAYELEKIAADDHLSSWHKWSLVTRALEIELRVAKTDGKLVSVVYAYPDELYAFLRSEHAPQHLRDVLVGGHVVDPNQPTTSVRRTYEEG